MKYLSALLFLVILSCQNTQSSLLERAQTKYATCESLSFERLERWSNTFIRDTQIFSAHVQYIKRRKPGFPYDFSYSSSDYLEVYDGQDYFYVDKRDNQIIHYNPEDTEAEVIYEGNRATMGSPMMVLQQADWERAGVEKGNAIYQRTVWDTEEDGVRSLTIQRLHLDSTALILVKEESINTRNGVLNQHLEFIFDGQVFDEVEELTYSLPEGARSIRNEDLEHQKNTELLQPGDVFPAFDFMDVTGESFTSTALSERKTVFTFSFIGCVGCETTRKALAASNFTFSDEFQGVYLNPRNTKAQVKAYHENKPWPMRLIACDFSFAESCGVYFYPTFITVNKAGVVEEVVEGYDAEYFAAKRNKPD